MVYVYRLEQEMRKLKVELQTSRQTEQELRSHVCNLTNSENSLRPEVSLLRHANEILHNKWALSYNVSWFKSVQMASSQTSGFFEVIATTWWKNFLVLHVIKSKGTWSRKKILTSSRFRSDSFNKSVQSNPSLTCYYSNGDILEGSRLNQRKSSRPSDQSHSRIIIVLYDSVSSEGIATLSGDCVCIYIYIFLIYNIPLFTAART